MRKDKQRLRRIIQNQELDRRVSHIELNRNRIYEEDKSQNSIHKSTLINFLIYLI